MEIILIGILLYLIALHLAIIHISRKVNKYDNLHDLQAKINKMVSNFIIGEINASNESDRKQ